MYQPDLFFQMYHHCDRTKIIRWAYDDEFHREDKKTLYTEILAGTERNELLILRITAGVKIKYLRGILHIRSHHKNYGDGWSTGYPIYSEGLRYCTVEEVQKQNYSLNRHLKSFTDEIAWDINYDINPTLIDTAVSLWNDMARKLVRYKRRVK